ncbi:MAG: hypothetical protein U1F26_01525 [Lysobacterales bacterium]
MSEFNEFERTVLTWGLHPVRGKEEFLGMDGTKAIYRSTITLNDLEKSDFRSACAQVADTAIRMKIDTSQFAEQIARALVEGSQHATQQNALRMSRLSPAERREYRKRAAQARSLAQWLADQTITRPIPTWRKQGVMHIYTEGSDREPVAFGDILKQRLYVKVEMTPTGASVHCEGGPRSVAKSMHRVADAINSLHWLADLLRNDADRARPEGAGHAEWKHTAKLLRDLFQRQLGEPMLKAVGKLTGLAHQCEVPASELSKLGKP